MHEVTMALRRLRRRPASGFATSLTLALGIGAVTAAFAAVDGVLLRDLPVQGQDELVVAWQLNPARGSLRIPFRYAGFELVARGVSSLSDVAAVPSGGPYPTVVEGVEEPYVLNQVVVAGDFFGVLGVVPTLGRLLTGSDDEVGAAPVIVLSHATWSGRWGADSRVVGSILRLADVAFTIVGVAPPRFDFPRGTDVWATVRGAHPNWATEEPIVELDIVGRLAPGADATTVAADLLGIQDRGFWSCL